MGTHYRCEISSYRPYGSSRACILQEPQNSSQTIVLLGNSHAQMYAPLMLEAIDKRSTLTLVPLNGCVPMTLINISTSCIEMANDNLQSILKDESVSTIAIATTWYSDEYIDKNGTKVDSYALKEAVDQLIKEISSSGKKVILFSPIPIPEKDYASELARKLHFRQISEPDIKKIICIPRAHYDKKFSKINNYIFNVIG